MDWSDFGLAEEIAAELEQLAQLYGEPLVQHVALASRSGAFAPQVREKTVFTEGPFAPIGKPDRFGEVCMVVRRPDGTLITARKRYYPPNAFRLLTGGISHGESIRAALLRETAEETGLDVEIARFLAAISYRPTDGEAPRFHTFAFLLDELGGTLGAVDEAEQVDSFGFARPEQLPDLAANLEALGREYHPEIGGIWSDWGRFRAVVHRAVADALR